MRHLRLLFCISSVGARDRWCFLLPVKMMPLVRLGTANCLFRMNCLCLGSQSQENVGAKDDRVFAVLARSVLCHLSVSTVDWVCLTSQRHEFLRTEQKKVSQEKNAQRRQPRNALILRFTITPNSLCDDTHPLRIWQPTTDLPKYDSFS